MSISQRKSAIAEYEMAYAASDFEVIQARYRKKLLLELLEESKPGHVLEIGCGFDTIVNHWSDFESFCLVEPGPQFAEKARQDVKHLPHVTVMEMFIEEAAKELKPRFDLILLSSLLHEVPHPEAILDAVHGLCNPDTLVHINVPNARSMHRLLALEMGLIASLEEPSAMQNIYKQPRIFDLDSLEDLVIKHGFEMVSHGSFFMKPFTHGQMSKLVAQGLVNEKMLDGFWGLNKHFPGHGSEIYINMRRK